MAGAAVKRRITFLQMQKGSTLVGKIEMSAAIHSTRSKPLNAVRARNRGAPSSSVGRQGYLGSAQKETRSAVLLCRAAGIFGVSSEGDEERRPPL